MSMNGHRLASLGNEMEKTRPKQHSEIVINSSEKYEIKIDTDRLADRNERWAREWRAFLSWMAKALRISMNFVNTLH